MTHSEIKSERAKQRRRDLARATHVFRGTRSDLAGLGQGSAVMAYACLWDEINGADSWNANPWVWVYTFERVREMPDAR